MAEEIAPEVREYMSKLGKKSTPAKQKSSRENAQLAAKARLKDPLTLPCTCTGGDSLNVADHKTTCPRGRLLWQRARKASKAD